MPLVLNGSLEMAWLWSASKRMEEDAQKVAVFLSKHGLDRYGALLTDEPGGLGASLETLAQADDDALEKAGLPPSPRRQLLDALRQREVKESAPSRPRSTASAPGDAARARVTPMLGEVVPRTGHRRTIEPQWGCLGRAPPGWHAVARDPD